MHDLFSDWRQQPYINITLILIMFVMFGLLTLSGGSDSAAVLLRYGAQSNPLIQAGQWWRLVTPIFLHIGLQHLLLNCLTLFYVGNLLEKTVGHFRYLVLFLGSGIGGNLFSFAAGNVISAGSSTAIFGLLGVFLMLSLVVRGNLLITETGITFAVFVGLNLLTDFFVPQIDIWGHLGGLLTGFCLAFVVGVPSLVKLAKKTRFFYANVLFIGIIVLCYIGMA
ncbi:GlpG protein (membrane protein of glp regulon) [Fructilactobacillus florum 8D]|uniref:GlpG protein (Membrane protein of glp regulon) n=1 Tax=Fructilactobacillus florum 8D TaxID=1221538 RepID=W9EFW7_9LACO|nr:rhomboid family intramembrane serine protease [Fructilactobacillus florum]ETO40171.1 GlpG protein (membrane protein of glp regulon) [Fructilactobacillus florum 8D]